MESFFEYILLKVVIIIVLRSHPFLVGYPMRIKIWLKIPIGISLSVPKCKSQAYWPNLAGHFKINIHN